MKFIGRTKEIDLLSRSISKKPSFVVLFGRRRVGKTTLLEIVTQDQERFFFTFSNSNNKIQMNEFKGSISSYLDDTLVAKIDGDWYDLFGYVFDKVEPGSLLILDEFTYAVRSDKKVISDLQRTWDRIGLKKDLRIVLCGSLMGMMKDEVLSHNSPLYGRRTRDIELQPLSLRESIQFFEDPYHSALSYMVVGGMPHYLSIAADHRGIEELIQKEFLDKNGYFFREGNYLVAQDLKDHRTYNSILRAISLGNTRSSQISDAAGMENRKIYPYLDSLMRLSWIEKEQPLDGDPKKGIYKLKDPMLHLWYNLTNIMRQAIELEMASYRKEIIHPVLGRLFEDLVRKVLVEYGTELGLKFNRIGSWWWKEDEMDIAMVDDNSKRVYTVECKYGCLNDLDVGRILNDLKLKWKKTSWSKKGMEMIPVVFCLDYNGKRKEVLTLRRVLEKYHHRKLENRDN
jgi:hypothetical protein